MSNPKDEFPVRYQKIGGVVFANILRHSLKMLNVRVAHYDRSVDPKMPDYNEHCIFVFWHEYIAVVVPHWSFSPVTMLVSQHRDAEWLTQAAIRLGYSTVRGSTSRGGTEAIRKLKAECKHRSLAITPDGPRGPRRKMAVGPLFLASVLNLPVVPVGVGYRRPWRTNSWDRFAVPRPFTRTRIIMGPKIFLPGRLRREQLENSRLKIESAIDQLTEQAEHWAHGDYDIAGEVKPSLNGKYLNVGACPQTNREEKLVLRRAA